MRHFKTVAIITICLLVNACKDEENTNKTQSPQEVKIESAADQLSYAIGFDYARDFKNNGFADVNIELLTLGMQDALNNKETKVSEEQAIKASTEIQARYVKQMEQEQEVNLKAGQDFLAENSKREGVITTESGLQYEILNRAEPKKGEDKKAQPNSMVKVHYHGTLIDGTVFDSSVERKEPVEFPLNGVIPGWQEGLQLMQTGDKFRFFIPADLAYGERSPGNNIPANAVLIFEVELLEINDPSANSINSSNDDGIK